MAFDSMGKGAAKGNQFAQEMALKERQLAAQVAQSRRRDTLALAEMQQRGQQQRDNLAESQRRFDLNRQDTLEQRDIENARNADLDEWKKRIDAQKMEAEDARIAQVRENTAALQRQNDEAIRQDNEKRKLYEQVPMEALFSALNTKKPDGSSMGCNLPGANAEIAKRLGLKSVEYSGFDENGVFAIKGTDEKGNQFIKQYPPEWVQGACDWFYGKDSPFAKQLGDRTKAAQEVATYGQKKAIDQENYEKNKGDMNLQDVMRRISIEVGKQEMSPEEAEKAIEFYRQQVAKGAPTPAPQKGGAEGQDELAALMAERERRAAAKGGQRNIPGMPKRQQEQPAPEPTQRQQTQQPAPQNEEVVSKPTTAEERKAAIAKIAKEYNIYPGQAERALNVATSKYNQDQRNGGKRSYDSFVTEQITWMMNRGQRTRGRTGRR